MKWLSDQITLNNKQAISELQMLFQNRDMYFVWGINTANVESQTANPFLYNTFNLPNNANISRCYLEVGNGNEYPDIHFKPATDPSRVYREVIGYIYANNDYQGGTFLNRANFESLYPFV